MGAYTVIYARNQSSQVVHVRILAIETGAGFSTPDVREIPPGQNGVLGSFASENTRVEVLDLDCIALGSKEPLTHASVTAVMTRDLMVTFEVSDEFGDYDRPIPFQSVMTCGGDGPPIWEEPG